MSLRLTFIMLVLLALPTARAAVKDYYQVLGVQRTASPAEIQSAYRKQMKKYHPDRNPGDKKAQQRAQEASEAYQVLEDPDKRAYYDRTGSPPPLWQDVSGEAARAPKPAPEEAELTKPAPRAPKAESTNEQNVGTDWTQVFQHHVHEAYRAAKNGFDDSDYKGRNLDIYENCLFEGFEARLSK